MNSPESLNYLNLENVKAISRGDKGRLLRYLNQFNDLLPGRMAELSQHLKSEDRKMVRQVLHVMNPQVQFFGVPGVSGAIQQLEETYESIPLPEMNVMVNEILDKLEKACEEMTVLIQMNE